jgi:hypothetical protein
VQKGKLQRLRRLLGQGLLHPERGQAMTHSLLTLLADPDRRRVTDGECVGEKNL